MTWDNTIAVLEAYSEEVVTRLQDALVEHGHVSSGDLFNTMGYHVEATDDDISAYLDHEDYLKYLEGGIQPAGQFQNPGWKAYPFIRDWVEHSPKFIGLEQKELPRVAFLVTRKIAGHEKTNTPAKGIDPDPMLEPILEEMYARYLPIIEEAVEKDVSDEVDRNLKEMFKW